MSIHGACFDNGQSGNCGFECSAFMEGDCEIQDEICEEARLAGVCQDQCPSYGDRDCCPPEMIYEDLQIYGSDEIALAGDQV